MRVVSSEMTSGGIGVKRIIKNAPSNRSPRAATTIASTMQPVRHIRRVIGKKRTEAYSSGVASSALLFANQRAMKNCGMML
jgi:hypothetical protein